MIPTFNSLIDDVHMTTLLKKEYQYVAQPTTLFNIILEKIDI